VTIQQPQNIEGIQNIEDVVAGRFATIMEIPRSEVVLDEDLQARYGITSLNALKLLSEVEVEFDIDIEQEEARGIKTLGDVVSLVRQKIAAAAAA
jgi:acyl carrier protein